MRSIECKGDGRGPMSLRKFSKLSFHLSQTNMPRAPYLWYLGLFGLLHRRRIPVQVLYSGLLPPAAWPCLKFPVDLLMQPQQVDDPSSRE